MARVDAPAAAEPDTAPGRVPAGAWLAARAAGAAHDFPAAGPLLAEALAADPLNPRLLDAAAAAALALGEIEAALPPARRLEALGAPSPAGRLAAATALARSEDWAGLLRALDAGRGASPLLDGLLRGWAELGLGRRDAALAAFDAVAAEPGLAAFGLTHKAFALAASGDPAGAAAILARPASQGMQRSRRGLMAQALALGAMGQDEAALDLLLSAFGPAPDAGVAALRDRIREGGAPAALVADARAGVAEALLGVAASLPEEADATASLLHARAALLVDPGLAEAAILAAERLATLGQPALALEAYALVAPTDPAFVEAETGRARTLRQRGEGAAAVEVLLALSRAHPDRPEVEGALADSFRAEGRWAEAEAAYGRAIDLRAGGDAAGGASLWLSHYARAIARDAGGDWPGAEADLRRALHLNPGEPRILNRLGYGLLERGEGLPEALALIERAAALDPDSGAVADSLGWALFRLGRHGEAVEALERAAALLPADPVINDHLGDAFWAVGRTREARFQWARALRLGPGEAEAEALRRKLAEGLPAAPAEPAASHAGLPGGQAGHGDAQDG